MNNILWALVLITVTIFPTDGLHCYQCLSLDCPGSDFREIGKEDPCEEVKEFAGRQIRDFYYFNVKSLISMCPEGDDGIGWVQLQTVSSCPGKPSEKTCSVGRLQIKTYYPDRPVMISHATILGCAGVNLLNSIKNAKLNSQCDLIVRNGTSATARYFHVLTMEHCSEVDTLCKNGDFCVASEQSVVKPFLDPKDNNLGHFDYGLMIGIVAFIVVIFAAIIVASVCFFPVNRPSNLPKPPETANITRFRPAVPPKPARKKVEYKDRTQPEPSQSA